MARMIRVFVAAPGDVDAERRCVGEVATALNRYTAAERDVHFRVLDWKRDARPRAHELGAQRCEVLINGLDETPEDLHGSDW